MITLITAIKNNKNIITFFTIITYIGLITGYKFYSYQNTETKTKINETLDIKTNLSYKTNNLLKDSKDILLIIICSVLLIPSIINIFNIFYKSFQIGFLYNILNTINTKLSILYISIYKLIPFILITILTKYSLNISFNLLKYFINKKNKNNIDNLIRNIKHFTYISIALLIYEFILFLYSEIINNYLITLLNII